MYFDDYWSLSLPFFGVMAGIILAQFFNFNKTQGLKLILALSGDILLGVYVLNFFLKYFLKQIIFPSTLWLSLTQTKKDPNITVEVSKKAVTYSPTMWQYHLRWWA